MDHNDVKGKSSKVAKSADTQDDLSKRLAQTKLTDSKIMVPEMLSISEDFVELRSYYVDIVRNMPDDYLKTVQLLESRLCAVHISDAFDSSSALDANQAIVTCLLEKANYKADVLDFCEALVSLKSSQLVNVVDNLRKAVMQNLQSRTEDTAMPIQTGQKSIDVTAKNVVRQIDEPQLSTAVHSQQAHGGQKITEASNATTSSSIPKSEEGLPNKQEAPRYPPTTAAALKAFDEYFTIMHNCVDPFRFIPKCIAHEIIEGDMYAAGTSVFLPNEIKMEPVLAEIRRFICLNGVDVFEKLLKVLRSEPTGIYKELADCMESFYLSHKNPENKEPHSEHEFKDLQIRNILDNLEEALKIFDEYSDRIHKCVEIDIFTAKCEQYGVLECTPITGASVYLPDDIKKYIVLPAIRNSIALNGEQVLMKMIKVLESMNHSHQLAIELQERLRLGYKSEFKLEILQVMLKEREKKSTIRVRYGKVLACGAGAAGKTNFFNLLMKKEFQPLHISTGLAESQRVKISQLSENADKKIAFLNDIDNEILQLRSKLPKEYTRPLTQQGIRPINEKRHVQGRVKIENTMFNKFIGSELKILPTQPEEDPEVLDIVTFMDTGGHPQFIKVLPAVNTFTMITFIVHKMTDGKESFAENVMVKHGNQHGYESFKPYALEYTYHELTETLMSYASSMLFQDKTFLNEFKESALGDNDKEVNNSSISFIGTHSNCVSENDIKEIDDKLIEMVKFAGAGNIKLNLNSNYECLIPVDSEMQEKDLIQACLNDKKFTNPSRICDYIHHYLIKQDVYSVPIKWLLLELEIRKMCINKNCFFITYDDVLELSFNKNLGEELFVKNGLRFHHMFGVLLYYEEVEGMCKLIITNPQWLFSKLTDIITYLFQNYSDKHTNCDNCIQKGIFKETLLDELEINTDFQKSGINTEIINPIQSFLNLLQHLCVIAPLNEDPSLYFMPSLLNSCNLANLQKKVPGTNKFMIEPYAITYLEPLLIRFKNTNALPRGIFCFLVVQLIHCTKWELYGQAHDNFVCFIKKDTEHYVTLTDRIFFLKVQVTHESDQCVPVLKEIFDTIVSALLEIGGRLRIKIELQYGFVCKDCEKLEETHMSLLTKVNNEYCYCEKNKPTKLDMSHKVWFKIPTTSQSDHLKVSFLNQKIIEWMSKTGADAKARYGRIIISGSCNAGKTSFFRLLMKKKFKEQYKSTGLAKHKQVVIKALMQPLPDKQIHFIKLNLENEKAKLESQLHLEFERKALDQKIQSSADLQLPVYATSDTESLKHSDENVWEILTFIDTGGQPEYIGMLPAVSSSVMVTFIVHNMKNKAEDLVTVTHSDEHSFDPYHLGCTNFQLIKSLISFANGTFHYNQPFMQERPKSYLSFIGTHLDRVPEEDVKKLDDILANTVYDAGIKYVWAEVNPKFKYLIPLDNTTAGKDCEDESAVKIRQKIHELLQNQKIHKVPYTWLTLDLIIRNICKDRNCSFMEYSEVVEICRHNKLIEEEEIIKDALRFHHLFGVLLYFEVGGMENYVITNHKWLFDKLTNIVLCSYRTDFDSNVSLADFKHRGIFKETLLDNIHFESDIEIDQNAYNIKKSFLNLLIHLKIIAPLEDGYFMPCLLRSYNLEKDEQKILQHFETSAVMHCNVKEAVESLLIQFKPHSSSNQTELLPRGVFCCLIVRLLQNNQHWVLSWSPKTDKVFSNLVTFFTEQKECGYFITIIDRVFFLEVRVTREDSDVVYEEAIYHHIYDIITNALNELKENYESDLNYGFLCRKCEKPAMHMTKFSEKYKTYLTCYCDRTKLTFSHKIWFRETAADCVHNFDSSRWSCDLKKDPIFPKRITDSSAGNRKQIKIDDYHKYSILNSLSCSSFSVSSAWDLKRLNNIKLDGTGTVIVILDTAVHQHFIEKEIRVFDCLSHLSTISLNHDTNFSPIPIFNCPDNMPENSIKHGTICSVIAVGSSQLSLRGVAPGAELIVYRVAEEKTFYVKAILEALKDIQYKMKNNLMQVDVISISCECDEDNEDEKQSLKSKIEELTEMGIAFVAAAGNRGGFQARASIPARFDCVISVGALDKTGDIAPYTAKGRTDVYAPGDVELPNDKDFGTSYAAPAVGGIILLLKQWANYIGSPAKDHIHCVQILRKIFSNDMMVKPGNGGEPIFDPVEFFMNMKDNPTRLNEIVYAYLCEEGTTAALNAFDMHFTMMQNSIVNQCAFISKCIDDGIIEDNMPPASDEKNDIQMEKALAKIRKCISLKGVDVFNKLLKVFRITEERQFMELADNMEKQAASFITTTATTTAAAMLTTTTVATATGSNDNRPIPMPRSTSSSNPNKVRNTAEPVAISLGTHTKDAPLTCPPKPQPKPRRLKHNS